MNRIALALVPFALICASAQASAYTRPQILGELQSLETCVRTMCLPANDSSMSVAYAKTVLAKLAVSPNNLDRWVTQRLNAAVQLLEQKKIREGLEALQASIKELPAA